MEITHQSGLNYVQKWKGKKNRHTSDKLGHMTVFEGWCASEGLHSVLQCVEYTTVHLKCLYTNASSMRNKQEELEALAMVWWKESWTGVLWWTKGLWRSLRDWITFHTRKGWDNWDCPAWRREGSGGNFSVCINTWKVGVQKVKPNFSQWYLVNG